MQTDKWVEALNKCHNKSKTSELLERMNDYNTVLEKHKTEAEEDSIRLRKLRQENDDLINKAKAIVAEAEEILAMKID